MYIQVILLQTPPSHLIGKVGKIGKIGKIGNIGKIGHTAMNHSDYLHSFILVDIVLNSFIEWLFDRILRKLSLSN